MKVVWSFEAMNSLENIYNYIFVDSPQNALMVFETLFDLGMSLENESVIYSIDPIINKQKFRHITKWSFKIIYEISNNQVIILDVFDGRQNPSRLSKY